MLSAYHLHKEEHLVTASSRKDKHRRQYAKFILRGSLTEKCRTIHTALEDNYRRNQALMDQNLRFFWGLNRGRFECKKHVYKSKWSHTTDAEKRDTYQTLSPSNELKRQRVKIWTTGTKFCTKSGKYWC